MADINEQIFNGTLSDDPSVAELRKRQAHLAADNDAPAALRTRGNTIFNTAILTDTPAVGKAGVPTVMVLRRSIEAIGGLFYEERQRKVVATVLDSASGEDESDIETAPTHVQRTPTPIRKPAQVEDRNEDDRADRIVPATAARRQRRMATHGSKPARVSTTAATVKGLQRLKITPKARAPELDDTTSRPTATLPAPTGKATDSKHDQSHSKQADKAFSPSLTVRLRVPKPYLKTIMAKAYVRTRIARLQSWKIKSEELVASDARDEEAVSQFEDFANTSSAPSVRMTNFNIKRKAVSLLHDDRKVKKASTFATTRAAKSSNTAGPEAAEKEQNTACKRTSRSTRADPIIISSSSAKSSKKPIPTPTLQRSAPEKQQRRVAVPTSTKTRETTPTPPTTTKSTSTPPSSLIPLPSTLSTPANSANSATTTSASPTQTNPAHHSQPPTKYTFPPLPYLPYARRPPFTLGASIALSNILEDHVLNPSESLLELVQELEENRPVVDDWERRAVVKGGRWVCGVLRKMVEEAGEEGGKGEGKGKMGEEGDVDVDAVVRELEGWVGEYEAREERRREKEKERDGVRRAEEEEGDGWGDRTESSGSEMD